MTSVLSYLRSGFSHKNPHSQDLQEKSRDLQVSKYPHHFYLPDSKKSKKMKTLIVYGFLRESVSATDPKTGKQFNAMCFAYFADGSLKQKGSAAAVRDLAEKGLLCKLKLEYGILKVIKINSAFKSNILDKQGITEIMVEYGKNGEHFLLPQIVDAKSFKTSGYRKMCSNLYNAANKKTE